MGYYINGKEKWLEENGIELLEPVVLSDWLHAQKRGQVLVVLIDSGSFTAAGIADNENEFRVFAREDHRSKRWFTVSKDAILGVCPDVPL